MLQGKPTTQCRSRDELGGAKAQRRTVSMTSLVLGSVLAFFPGARSTNSVRRLPQVTGPLPSIRRARPLIVACQWSSGAMARTGLRMMPTFPSPPLKFRTAGFPQYGFKASMSDSALLQVRSLKPAPGIRLRPCSLLLSFARFHHRGSPGSESKTIQASTRRCAGGFPSLPQGSLAPVRVMLSRSIIAYYSPMRQSRRHAATSRLRLYAAPSLCGSA